MAWNKMDESKIKYRKLEDDHFLRKFGKYDATFVLGYIDLGPFGKAPHLVAGQGDTKLQAKKKLLDQYQKHFAPKK